MANFYRRSLRHAAQTQSPLHRYLLNFKKNDKREMAWTTEAEAAFKKTKNDLADATLLAHPSADAQTRIVTDASDIGMGES